jgi:hypothetical protein
MPQFEGGTKALNRFIVDRVQASKKEIRNHKPIFVEFVVDTTGQVVNVCIVRRKADSPIGTPTTLEQEILRIVPLLSLWTPGRQGRRKVPIQYGHAIKF